MEEDDYDDILPEANIFAFRADNIMKSKLEAVEKFRTQIIEEEAAEIEENEFNDLLGKIKEKLKKKPASRKRKTKNKNTKAEDEPTEEEISPPRITRGSSRRKKTKADVESDEASEKKEVATPVNLPVLAKKRLKELKLKTDREAAQVEEEIRRALSSCDNDFLEVPEATSSSELPLENNICLKVRFMSEISKVDVSENEKFATIFTKVADLYKLKASEILLCLEDKNIHLDDTPLSLKLKFYDIIDCIPYKASKAVIADDDPNKLLIKVQSSDSRRKIEMHTHKLEKFQDFMEKYSKVRGIPLKDLVFEFDGEKIEGSETAEDLEMESGSCIDVKVTKPHVEKVPSTSPVTDFAKPIPESDMLQICVID